MRDRFVLLSHSSPTIRGWGGGATAGAWGGARLDPIADTDIARGDRRRDRPVTSFGRSRDRNQETRKSIDVNE